MTAARTLSLLFVLAFLGVGVARTVSTRPSRAAQPAEAAQQERVRQFWDRYRAASRYRAAGDLKAAISLYQQALALKPDHEDSLYYLGNCFFEAGRWQEAARVYTRLIGVNRAASSRGYVQLGLLHADRQAGSEFDLRKADRFFRQALQTDPDSGALLGIGEVALLQGERSRAREALEGDNADNAMGVAAPYLLGYLCWRDGPKEEAWRWFRLAVSRCKVKKPPVKWSEEGDLKADPELRWRALARQSVFGSHWIRLRHYLQPSELSSASMQHEYQRLQEDLTTQK
jgi:tetratricopeptide (TPR) repeat protein